MDLETAFKKFLIMKTALVLFLSCILYSPAAHAKQVLSCGSGAIGTLDRGRRILKCGQSWYYLADDGGYTPRGNAAMPLTQIDGPFTVHFSHKWFLRSEQRLRWHFNGRCKIRGDNGKYYLIGSNGDLQPYVVEPEFSYSPVRNCELVAKSVDKMPRVLDYGDMKVEVTHITVLVPKNGACEALLYLDLPPCIYPFNDGPHASLLLSRDTYREYLTENFPGIGITVIPV